jgi:mono/diheme cytochrome c family protein
MTDRGLFGWRATGVLMGLALGGLVSLHAEPPVAGTSRPAPPPESVGDAGLATLYTLHCSGCHGAAGHGVPSAGIPDLHDAGSYVVTPAGRAYLVSVPGLAQSSLDDAAAARMLNYVLRRFSGDALPADFKPYSVDEVSRLRADVASDAVNRRDRILAELKARGRVAPAGYRVGQ